MKFPRIAKALDYLPPIVAFGAALVAIVGAPKWNEQGVGIEKVTSTGWIVAIISLAALVTTTLVTLRNHRQQASQQSVRAQISRTGREQLLRGVQHTVCVFKNSHQWDKANPEPSSPLDLLNSDQRSALALVNLNSMSSYADGKGNVKWWEMFENTALKGSAQIASALQTYVTFLDSTLIEAATRLLNCEFMFRLQHTHEIIDANTRGIPERPVQFFWVSPDEHMRAGYEEFWPLVTEVIRLCSENGDDWGDREPSECD
ncbi:hypothetical protein H9L17_13280 [Thermomonas brevis]|uniref:DUF4760 domain-containing protein n=1 Tax=Thermomonas brevis TaxID=215691 RepID=A0A7G9QS14_9GAMM|nr:hypothetical protein [Thermomonas brevis]QNN46139.1 hypothetical protein H9L17_13280 [Thermomonas brevis]